MSKGAQQVVPIEAAPAQSLTSRLCMWLPAAILWIALCDLGGWIAHIRILTSVLPGYATMKPNTAICLGMLAFACLLNRRKDGTSAAPRAWIGTILAALAFALSGLTLAEVILRTTIGVDTLLLHVPRDTFGDPAGRMSPGTALCLTVCALALILLDSMPRLSSTLILIATVVSLSGLIGFLFGAGPLLGVPALKSLAVHTASALLMLQLTSLGLRPEREPVRSLLTQQIYYGGRRSRLLPAVTIVPTLVAFPLVIGLRHGWFDAPYAIALLVVLLTGIQTFLLWQDSSVLMHLEERKKMAEQALLQSEKLAVVGRLAASISHEINNPLEAVGNLLYLVRTEDELERARQYALSAEEELSRVAQITAQTLSFYRENRREVDCSASAILESALKLLSSKIAASGITVTCEFTKAKDDVHCRDGELRQVFINLISNSLEATSSGGRLRVRTHLSRDWSRDGLPGVRMIVADTGCGMTRAVQQRVFEPFFTTKQETGNGLGLWVAQDLIEKQEGSLKVWSSTLPGKTGTVFSIFLPLASAV